ncbi:MAG: PAS domain S-box protein, partial [Candidatus Latescibacteria bacterium]|nr:PAS domain S-box protein [Candidatus Latescibacterota bacterium]
NAPIIVWNPDRQITIFNEAFEKMSGRSEAEMTGQPLNVLFPEDSRSDSLKKIEEASKGEHWKTEEIPILRRNGEIRIALWNSANIYGEDGKTLIATVAQGQDITEHKQADEALRESEEKYRNLVERANDGIAILQNGNLRYVNPALEAMSGYTAEELIGTRFTDHVHPDELPKVVDRYNRRMTGEAVPEIYETAILHRDGRRIDAELNAGLCTYQGKPADLVLIRDTTERKQVEEELQRYKLMVESSNDAMFIKDLESRYVLVNRKVLELFGGISAEEIIGKNDTEIMSLEDAQCNIKDDREVFKTDEIKDFLKKNTIAGEDYWLHATKIPLRDDKGKVIGLIGIARDITERKHLEEQLRQAQKMKAIGTLAGGVAHDFNNLLTAIQGNTELALMNIQEDTFSYRKLSEIRKAAMRAANLTRQLLLFSRQQPMAMKLLDLNEIIEEEANMLDRLIGEHIVLTTELKPGLWKIEGDIGAIEQVIMNLVINARDALTEGGEITIGSRNVQVDEAYCRMHEEARPGKFVCLSVRDTGEGIDPGILDRIFEPFFTTKGLGVGTGLGLSVVYGIVKKHEGWITVESDSGNGTLFRTYLPAVLRRSGKKETPGTPVSPEEAFRGHGARILLVEDDDAIRALSEEILSGQGYVVLPAATVQEAWNVFDKATGNFDLLFCDVVLPDGRGPELVKRLLERRPGIRVLFTSGYSTGKSDGHSLLEGEYPYLQKPYQLSDLLKAVHDALKADVRDQGSGKGNG